MKDLDVDDSFYPSNTGDYMDYLKYKIERGMVAEKPKPPHAMKSKSFMSSRVKAIKEQLDSP